MRAVLWTGGAIFVLIMLVVCSTAAIKPMNAIEDNAPHVLACGAGTAWVNADDHKGNTVIVCFSYDSPEDTGQNGPDYTTLLLHMYGKLNGWTVTNAQLVNGQYTLSQIEHDVTGDTAKFTFISLSPAKVTVYVSAWLSISGTYRNWFQITNQTSCVQGDHNCP